MTPAFVAGAFEAMTKVAALDTTVHKVVTTALKSHLPAGQSPAAEDELETLLPNDGDLEAVMTALEENFDIHFPSDLLFALFAGGKVKDLEEAIVEQLLKKKPATKTAAFDSHAYYMRNRARRQQQSRQYRMRNMHQIRRRSRIYRAQVRRGARRQRKRMGSAAGGYTFVAR